MNLPHNGYMAFETNFNFDQVMHSISFDVTFIQRRLNFIGYIFGFNLQHYYII